ncbi:LysR family transcriptional regulator [Geminicoccus roseus]|uniref:LysR family transcriptional regulator n=1 Tax=Geminicoccus roseus TaxID=404900 RepID=UPI0004148A1F|nr:LysR family transcriptional regulator [Geminicoccus roseus]
MKLPPLPSVRMFVELVEAGRLGPAAERLGVTDSAITHQIRKLEADLGLALFERDGRYLRLTPAGREFHGEVAPALERIALARARLRGEQRPQVVLTLPPSLARAWILDKVAAFEAALPGVELRLLPVTRLVELERERVDIAIRYLSAGVAGEGHFLHAERAFPVCAPAIAARADWARVPVLRNEDHPLEWQDWQRLSGALTSLGPERMRASSLVLMDAAAAGNGLAIGRTPIVDPYLADGRLVAPFGTDWPTGGRYLLVVRRRGRRPEVVAAERWLSELRF